MVDFDDLVIGTGTGGLAVASPLAASGRKALLLEARDVPFKTSLDHLWLAKATAGFPSA